MGFVLEQLLRGLLAPALVAGAATLAACLRSRPVATDAGRPVLGGWPGALAVAPGFLTALLLIKGFPGLWPVTVLGWLFHAALAGAALGLLEGGLLTGLRPASPLWSPWFRLGWGWGLRAVCVLLLILVTLRPKLSRWEPGQVALALVGLELLGLSLWLGLDQLRAALAGPGPGESGEPEPGAGAVVATLGLIGGSGGVLVLGGSAVLGQLAGALAAAGAPLLGAALWRPGLPLLRGAGPPLALLLGGLLLNGAFYTPDLSPAVPLLLAAAPWGGQVARLPWLRGRPGWQRAAAATAGALLLVGAAAGVALATAPADDPYAGY